MDRKILCKRSVMTVFPKVELHRHIEGSFDLATLFEISKKNKIDAPTEFEAFKREAQFPKGHKPDFKLFLSKFRNDWYRSLDDVQTLIYKSAKNFRDEHLHHIELRFSPEHFALFNNFDRLDTSKVIIEAGNRAAKEGNFSIRYLITFNRNKQNQDEMLSLYKKLVGANLTDIVGYDLAGDELLNPAEEFTKLFDVIRSDGLGITIHAGEVTPPEQIWAAIEKLHAQRVGHGTTAINDDRLQKELKQRKIYLEQCPVSNYFTGSWIDTPLHPFKQLHGNGVLVTLNSDDPTIQNTTLADDYVTAAKFYVSTLQGLVDLNIRSLRAAFLSESERQKSITHYRSKVTEFISEVAKNPKKYV